MKKLAMLLALLAFASTASAQNIPWEKTAFPGNCTKQIHVTTSSFAGYTNLVGKYGGDWVRKFNTYADLDNIEGLISTGDVACVLFYPGTYSFTDAWSISKPVQIMSASGNPDDVNLDGDTSNVDVLIFADGSDGSSVRNVRVTLDNATSAEEDGITINSGADGVVIDNVTFIGSSTASTDAQGVTVAGDRAQILNSRFYEVGVTGSIIVSGDDTLIRGNRFIGSKASQVAIDVNSANTASAGLRVIVEDNTISLTAASSDVGIKTASNALNNIYARNRIFSADKISSGTANSTLILFENVNGASAGADLTTAAWITD